jgi:hypothetical protein
MLKINNTFDISCKKSNNKNKNVPTYNYKHAEEEIERK